MAIRLILRLYGRGHGRFQDGRVTSSLRGQTAMEPCSLKRQPGTEVFLRCEAAWQANPQGLFSTISLSNFGKKKESNLAFRAVIYFTPSIPSTILLVTSLNGMQKRVGYLTTQ